MTAVPGTLLDEAADQDAWAQATPGARAAGLTGRSLIAGVRFYQACRSGRPTGCRYLPTCSEYAIEAITEHGAGRGSLLAGRRLLRCNPWGGHGLDPVPTGRTTCTHH